MNKVIAFLKKISLKQILTVFLAGVMVLTLAACSGAEVGDNSSEEAPVTTETTEQPAPEAAQPAPEAVQPAPEAAQAPGEEAPGEEAASSSVDEGIATSEEG